MDPYRFWERQKDAANVSSPGYSYNSLFGKMIVTVTDAGARACKTCPGCPAMVTPPVPARVSGRGAAAAACAGRGSSPCAHMRTRCATRPAPADKCRELMAVNDPTRMLMVLHPSAKTIMGANNLAFLHGDEHKAIRKSFVSLFTRKALSTYAELQDGIIRAHLAKWLQKPEFREVRDDVR